MVYSTKRRKMYETNYFHSAGNLYDFNFRKLFCRKKTAKNVIGTWKDVKSDNLSLIFKDDNTGSFSSKDLSNVPLTWEAGENTVKFNYYLMGETSATLTLVDDNGVLKLVGEDEKVVYVQEENYESERKKVLEEIKANTVAIEVNKTYEDADYANFKVIKIVSAEKITGSMGSSISYTPSDGNIYIDVVMDYTNNTSNTIACDELITFKATKADGTMYDNASFFVETDNGTSITSYTDVAPLATVRLHCALSVPKGEGQYTLSLDVDGQMYGYEYTLNQVVNNAKAIKINDVLENEDIAKAVFKSVKFTTDLLPSNTSGYYNHYPVDNAANTYLVVRFDITNNQTSARDCEEFVNVTATFMDKYTYTGFVVVEDTDGKGFSSYEDIDPLSTRKLYCLIEVPKTVAESNYELTISFAGEEYSYKG